MKHLTVFILILFMSAVSQAEFYADGAQTGTGHDGNEVDPYSKADMLTAAKVPAGNTVYCRNAFGDISFTSSTTKGSAGGGYVTFSPWSGQTAPTATKVWFTDDYDAYIRFDGVTAHGWTITHTADTNPTIAAVSASQVDYVKFTNCYISHEFFNAAFAAGDFYPYYIGPSASQYANQYTISLKAGCDNWTFDGCTIEHGYRLINLKGTNPIITDCDFGRCGEDHINSATGADIIIQDCTFTDTWSYYSVWFYPSVGSGVLTGALVEGDTVVQDTSGAIGMVVGILSDKLYIIAKDQDYLPDLTTNAAWKKDVDNYWTPGGVGNNQHCDSISVQGSAITGLIVRRNYFHTGGGQALKISDDGGNPDDLLYENNVIHWNRSGTYAVLFEGGTNVGFQNNTIIHTDGAKGINGNAPTGTFTLRNNIVTGALDQLGTYDSDYNAWESTFPFGAEAHGLQSQNMTTGWFTDYTNAGEVAGDFALIAGAPAIGIADAVTIPADDYTGATRHAPDDIGAYDYYVGGVKYFMGLK